MAPLTSATASAVDATDADFGGLTGKDGRGRERLVDGNENAQGGNPTIFGSGADLYAATP